jgi:hypothetical protein
VGPACASDVHLGLLALAGARAQGQLLTDAGFDAISLRQLAAQKGLVAHIPLKGGRGRRGGSWAGGTSIPPSTGCGGWWRASPGPLRPGSPVATSRRCSPMAQKRAYLDAVVRGLAAAPFNGLVTALAL